MITSPKEMVLDQAQVALQTKLDTLAASLGSGFLAKIFRSKKPVGIYIYGSVGSGKTMLSRSFFDKVENKKLFVHYQDFMRGIHQFFHDNKGRSKEDIISRLAQSYSKRAKVLCLDEFEVKDITDAMFIGRIVAGLVKRGVFVLITTNNAPENLYKDGLQRELFLPFIDYLSKNFDIFPLKSAHDYRMDRVASVKRMLYPLNVKTKKQMQEVITTLTDPEHLLEKKLEIFGRSLALKKTYKSVLVTNFEELCKQMLSYNDYIEICKEFSTIILEDVPALSSENTDEAIRFINLIDNIYFHHNILFISMAASPEELYPQGKRKAEFKRTISRLHEIESDSYFKH